MVEQAYSFVFQGIARGGYRLDDIKLEMIDTLGLKRGEVDRLFTGEPVVMTQVKDEQSAADLRDAIERIGGVCWFERYSGSPSKYCDRRHSDERRAHGAEGAFDPDRRAASGRRYDDPVPS